MSTPNNKVSLGCGTLILIALIVMIFGNSHRDDDTHLKQQIATLQSDVSELKSDVSSLKSDIKDQSATLSKIKDSLEEISKRFTQVRPRIVPAAPRTPGSPTPEAPLPEN